VFLDAPVIGTGGPHWSALVSSLDAFLPVTFASLDFIARVSIAPVSLPRISLPRVSLPRFLLPRASRLLFKPRSGGLFIRAPDRRSVAKRSHARLEREALAGIDQAWSDGPPIDRREP